MIVLRLSNNTFWLIIGLFLSLIYLWNQFNVYLNPFFPISIYQVIQSCSNHVSCYKDLHAYISKEKSIFSIIKDYEKYHFNGFSIPIINKKLLYNYLNNKSNESILENDQKLSNLNNFPINLYILFRSQGIESNFLNDFEFKYTFISKDFGLYITHFIHIATGMNVFWAFPIVNYLKYIDDIFQSKNLFETIKIKSNIKEIHAKQDIHHFMSIVFKTPVHDHSGISHIVEHLTLCGSLNYPISDPFFSMTKRSLHTYMNAFTASDHTQYLFSSKNQKDFENIMKIYLDAVYLPILRSIDFDQEAYRINNSSIDGVVFNEMKGAFDNPIFHIAMFTRWIMYGHKRNSFTMLNLLNNSSIKLSWLPLKDRYIFPNDTNYQQDIAMYQWTTGGSPLYIPCLNHQDVLSYYKRFYKPSNSAIFMYGGSLYNLTNHLNTSIFPSINNTQSNIDKNRNLSNSNSNTDCLMEESQTLQFKYLNSYDHKIHTTYISEREQSKIKLLIAIPVGQSIDVIHCLKLILFSNILFNVPRGPIYQRLIITKKATSILYSGLESSSLIKKHLVFTLGLDGVEESDVDAIERDIISILSNIQIEGVDLLDIMGVLNQIELSLKYPSQNIGEQIGMNIITSWLHHEGSNIENIMNINNNLQNIRNEIKNSIIKADIKNENPIQKTLFFSSLIEQYFLNQAFETVVFHPVTNFHDEINEKLNLIHKKKLVEKMNTSHDSKDDNKNKMDDISILPTLTLDDINRNYTSFIKDHVSKEIFQNVFVFFNRRITNGIIHLRLRSTLNLTLFNEEDLLLLPILTDILSLLPTTRLNTALTREIDFYTNGIHTGINIISKVKQFGLKEIGVTLSSSCLVENINKMMELLTELLFYSKIEDVDMLQTFINEKIDETRNYLLSSSHEIASSLAGSNLTEVGRIHDLINGYSNVQHLLSLTQFQTKSHVDSHTSSYNETKKDYNKEFDDAKKRLISKFQSLLQHIRNPIHFSLYVTTDDSSKIRNQIIDFAKNITNEQEKTYANLHHSTLNQNSFQNQTLLPHQSRLQTDIQLPSKMKQIDSDSTIHSQKSANRQETHDSQVPQILIQSQESKISQEHQVPLKSHKLHEPPLRQILEESKSQDISKSLFSSTFLDNNTHYLVILPITSNSVSKQFLGVPFGHDDFAILDIISTLLNLYLHKSIREQGGAYGVFSHMLMSGVLSITTYRDPRTIASLNDIDDAIRHVCRGEFNDQDLLESKLQLFQGLDTPKEAHMKGVGYFLNQDIDDNMIQRHRSGIYDSRKEDVVRICKRYLEDLSSGNAIFGSLNQELDDLRGWKKITLM